MFKSISQNNQSYRIYFLKLKDWLQEVDYVLYTGMVNPLYSHDITFITLSLGSALALGNENNITSVYFRAVKG